MLAETLAVTGPVPLAGLTESHGAPGGAVHDSEPVPPFEIPSDCEAGLRAAHRRAEARLAGLTTSTGDDGRARVRREGAVLERRSRRPCSGQASSGRSASRSRPRCPFRSSDHGT